MAAPSPPVSVIPASIALQLFAHHIAACCYPIDQPRNLAKSVAVE